MRAWLEPSANVARLEWVAAARVKAIIPSWGGAMKRIGIALVALSLSACDGPVTRDEVADIASDYADTSELESRIDQLESEIGELKGENAVRARDIATNASSIADLTRWTDDEVSRLTRNDKAFIEQINYLRANQGWGVMPSK